VEKVPEMLMGKEYSRTHAGLDRLAKRPILVENTSPEELVLIKFFGPDINDNAPDILLKRESK